MKRDQIKKWLDSIGNDEVKVVYLDDGQESLINPNMGYALRDEIFEWQDKLDDIDYSEKGFTRSFFDLVNDYCDAKKIGEIVQATEMLISYVTNHIKNVDCYISDGRLWIKPIGNASCSASILSYALNIDAKNIDDTQFLDRIWSIHLYRR